jgi:hypothetical protein
MIRLFHVSRRLIVASGRARPEVVAALCESSLEELNSGRGSYDWTCQATEEKGHFIAVWSQEKDGKRRETDLTTKAIDDAFDKIRLAWARESDPTAIDAYEARTLERATSAQSINIPSPNGMVQVLGRLHSVTYDGTLQGQDSLWQHEFKEDSQPVLVSDEKDRLFIVGGVYRVDPVGIVDEEPEGMPGGFEAVDFLEEPAEIETVPQLPTAAAPARSQFESEDFWTLTGNERDDDALRRDAFSTLARLARPSAPGRAADLTDQRALSDLAALSLALSVFRPSDGIMAAIDDIAPKMAAPQKREIHRMMLLALADPLGSSVDSPDRTSREYLLRVREGIAKFYKTRGGLDRAMATYLQGVKLGKLTQSKLAGLAEAFTPGLSAKGMKKAELKERLEALSSSVVGWNPTERPFSRAPLGEGGRFKACVSKMRRRGDVDDPKALCASIGRKKYGAKRMAAMAKRGRRNPYTDTQRETFGELAELASNPAHYLERPDWRDVYDQAELYLDVLYELIGSGGGHMLDDAGEALVEAKALRRMAKAGVLGRMGRKEILEALQAATDDAEASLEEHEETEGVWGSNPLGFEEEELVIGVAPPRDAHTRVRRAHEGKGRDDGQEFDAKIEELKRDNPKKDGKWHIQKSLVFGTTYYLDAGDVSASVVAYKPRKHPGSRRLAIVYERQHGQQLPAGTKYLTQSRRMMGGGTYSESRWTAHTSLAKAKKAAERELKGIRSNPVTANAGLLAGSPARNEGFGVDGPLTNAGILAMPGAARPNTFGLSRQNAGLIDPPQVRRSLPRQP